MKRWFSLCLVMLLCVAGYGFALSDAVPAEALFPEPAVPLATPAPQADVSSETRQSGDYTYLLLADGTAEIYRYEGSAAELVIPAEIDGYPVKGISFSAVAFADTLTALTIPEGVTTARERAVDSCPYLTRITVPDSLVHIGTTPFNQVTDETDNIMSVELVISPDHPYLFLSGNVLFGRTDHRLIQCMGPVSGDYAVPDGVCVIADYAFRMQKDLVSVTIPEGVTEIGDNAFECCPALTAVILPDGLTTIGNNVFNICDSLETITIPASVTSIGEELFGYPFDYHTPVTVIVTPGSYAEEWCRNCRDENVICAYAE